MIDFVSIACLFWFYWLIQLGLRFVSPVILWSMFGVLPLLMTPYWLSQREFDGFVWLKIYSVLFCVCWGTWFRFRSKHGTGWAEQSIFWLLCANIAEATFVDFWAAKHGLLHWLNGAAGLLLILRLIGARPKIFVEGADQRRELNFDLQMPWIIGYTLWNWSFVALNYSAFLGHHTAILLAALFVAYGNSQRWVQARAATLGANLLLMACSPEMLLRLCDTSNWSSYQPQAMTVVVAVSWILADCILSSKTGGKMTRWLKDLKSWRVYLLGSSMTPVQFGGATRRF